MNELPIVAIDAAGYWWRLWGEDPNWSMVPTNPDNSPIPKPVKFYRLVEVKPADCEDCKKMRNCEHTLESGSHGFGCDKCGMSGVAGVAWCRQGHGRENLK